jgi:sugar (pentulose or hexulose) kinase
VGAASPGVGSQAWQGPLSAHVWVVCLLPTAIAAACCAGLLEGMSRIEADAYQLLTKLSATPVKRVLTAGGGAVNDKWTAMRAAALGVPVAAAAQGMTQQRCHLCARLVASVNSLQESSG